jgi:hypothetical protein
MDTRRGLRLGPDGLNEAVAHGCISATSELRMEGYFKYFEYFKYWERKMADKMIEGKMMRNRRASGGRRISNWKFEI